MSPTSGLYVNVAVIGRAGAVGAVKNLCRMSLINTAVVITLTISVVMLGLQACRYIACRPNMTTIIVKVITILEKDTGRPIARS